MGKPVKRTVAPSFAKSSRTSSVFVARSKGRVGGWKDQFGVLRHSLLPPSAAQKTIPCYNEAAGCKPPNMPGHVRCNLDDEYLATDWKEYFDVSTSHSDSPEADVRFEGGGTASSWQAQSKSKARKVRGSADLLAASSSDAPEQTDPTKLGSRVLHLFSGPSPRADGLAHYLQACRPSIHTVEVDIINSHLEDQDLVDDAVWTRIKQRLVSGDFSFVFAGPPCRTFSDARLSRPGPPALRSQEFLYGFPKSQAKTHGLLPKHFEQIRTDNLLAERTAEACAIMHHAGHGYAVEQPLGYKSGSVSMFDLHCFSELKERGARYVDFHQCMFGAGSIKPTRFLYWNGRFDLLESQCDHPRTIQIGQRWVAHQPLSGRDEHGAFKTKAASAYPDRLNMWLASIINLELSRPTGSIGGAIASQVLCPRDLCATTDAQAPDGKIVDDIMAKQSAFFGTTALSRAYDLAGPKSATGPAVRASENWQCLGGMRRPDRSVLSNDGYNRPGRCLQAMAEQFVDDHPESMAIAESLRIGDSVTGFDESIKAEFRRRWMHTLGAASSDRPIGPDPETLEAWGRAVGDYDAARILPSWLRNGAPIGVLEVIETAGVFPAVAPDEAPKNPDTLSSCVAGWTNYASADSEPQIVMELLQKQKDKGHCNFFDSMPQLCAYLQVESAVLTKLALITKVKPDGTKKHRLIWDLLRSEVNATVSLTERIVLPRIQDAVDDASDLLRQNRGDLEWLVLDIADAFHNIPMLPAERKFTCGKVGNKFIVFEVLCMGGKSSPNIWGRFAAAIGRILASLFDPGEFRCEIYVDDPLMAVVGSFARRQKLLTMALLTLDVLNFPLAWEKGIRGTSVVWIGAQLTAKRDSVQVTIPADKLQDLSAQTIAFRKQSVVYRNAVRSYCGKLSFVAGMVPVLRPFLSIIWAALSSKSRLPPNLVHCRRFHVALDWFLALFKGIHGPLVRDFPLHQQWAPAGDYIATDACPWGFAGVLFSNNSPVAWFANPISRDDQRRFGKKGDCKHNTTWEALAILVAIRIWLPGTQVLARIKSDSLSALRSMVKLSSSSPALGLIAREIALDSVLGLYTVGVAVHIPGVSNVLPDDLSRMWAPEPHAFPSILQGVAEHVAPERDRAFWKTTQLAHKSRGHKRRERQLQG